MQLRCAYSTDPAHPDDDDDLALHPRHRVALRHPGYPDRVNVLLTLHAPDAGDGGLHHDTAHAACAIVTGNRYDGFLSESRDPSLPPAPLATPSCAPAATTSTCPAVRASSPAHPSSCALADRPADDSATPYPVVPRFADWLFPHDALPSPWRYVGPEPLSPTPARSSASAYILSRDLTCRLTGHADGAEVAHLCPRSEDRWFHRNGMERYILNPRRSGLGAVDDAANAILLRADVHHVFDQARFVFVPKPRAHGGEDPVVVAHVMDGSRSLLRLYHNVALLPLKDVAVEFIFSRFAWAVFSFLQGFVLAGVPRALSVMAGDDGSQEAIYDGDACRDLLAPASPSRSRSPKKRNLDTGALDAAGESALTGRKRARLCTASPAPPPRRRRRPTPTAPPGPLESSQARASSDATTPSLSSSRGSRSPLPSNVDGLVEEHLRRQREQSDPHRTWAKECDWAHDATSRPLRAEEVRRWYAFQGFDVIEAELSP